MSDTDGGHGGHGSHGLGRALEHDHRAIDEHFAAVGAALDDGRVDGPAFHAGAQALRRHIWVEETLHFPPLRARGLLGPVLVMLKEHGDLWRLLGEIEILVQARAGAAGVREPNARLRAALEAHNLKEERVLYPAGDQVLDAATAAEVRAALTDGEVPDDWAPEMAG